MREKGGRVTGGVPISLIAPSLYCGMHSSMECTRYCSMHRNAATHAALRCNATQRVLQHLLQHLLHQVLQHALRWRYCSTLLQHGSAAKPGTESELLIRNY